MAWLQGDVLLLNPLLWLLLSFLWVPYFRVRHGRGGCKVSLKTFPLQLLRSEWAHTCVSLCLNCQINSVPFTAALTGRGTLLPVLRKREREREQAFPGPVQPFSMAGVFASFFLPAHGMGSKHTTRQVTVGLLVSTNL